MKAIVTKFHGPTDFKGSRYSATAEGVGRVILQTDFALNSDENHERVARALADKYGWLKDGTRLVGGGMPDGRMAWVFVRVDIDALTDLVSVKDLFQSGQRGGEVMGVISAAMDKAEATLKGGR